MIIMFLEKNWHLLEETRRRWANERVRKSNNCRFMAISHPIVYAQHGMRSSRALISISIVWGLSIAIGLPILLGMNQDDEADPHVRN